MKIKIPIQHLLKTVVLGFFALYFIRLHSTGKIFKYINPQYDYISKTAAIIFIILFLVQLFRVFQRKNHQHHVCSAGCHHGHDHANGQSTLSQIFGYGVMIFPLITGFTFEPATLNASIAANKGSFYSQVGQSKDFTDEEANLFQHSESLADKENIDIYSSEHVPLVNTNYLSDEEYEEKFKVLDSKLIQMNEDMFGSYFEEINNNPSDYIGRTIKMSGFVYKEDAFSSNQLVISRFMIVHCIADAAILGFLTEFDEANTLVEDTWLEIEGTLDVTNYDGVALPIVKAAKWRVIDEPDEPYIYPVIRFIQ